MTPSKPVSRRLVATVDEVLAASGLAFLRDDENHEWTVTRSTPGADFADMRPGQKWQVVVDVYPEFSIATGIAPH